MPPKTPPHKQGQISWPGWHLENELSGVWEDSEFDLLIKKVKLSLKASLSSLCAHQAWRGDIESFQRVPSLCLGYHWGAGSQTKCLCAWNGSSNFFSCWSEVTRRLKPDNPHTTSELPFSSFKGLLSLCLLTTHLSSRAEKAGDIWNEKKKNRPEKRKQIKSNVRKGKKWNWNLQTVVRGNHSLS